MSQLADVNELDENNKLKVIFPKENELKVKSQKILTW
jgi:hypothetical protein